MNQRVPAISDTERPRQERTIEGDLRSLMFLTIVCIALGSTTVVSAQAPPRTEPGSINPPPIGKSQISDEPTSMGSMGDEMRVKQAIKLREKEYKENVDRAREVAELGAQLREAQKKGQAFGRDEYKKLDRLEKLAKKIRSEAGGVDEEESDDSPPSKLESALSRLAEVAESLFNAVQETPPKVISAGVIEKVNTLLQLAKVTRNLFH